MIGENSKKEHEDIDLTAEGGNEEGQVDDIEVATDDIVNKSETGEKVEKKKVEIDPEMPPEEIMEKFNVSRTTAWRIRKRGYVNLNYRVRVMEPDLAWNRQNEEAIMDSAKKGAISILSKMAHSCGQTVDEFLKPYSLIDAVQEGALRIMELSGNPDRDSENWRVAVAKIGACKFLEQMIKKARWKSYDSAAVSKVDTIKGILAEEMMG